VVTDAGGNSVTVARVSGFGTSGQPLFATPVSYPVGTTPVSVTITDLNGDGIPDLLVANQGSNDVSVLFGSLDAQEHWVATAGPRLRSAGSGPIAPNLVSDPSSPGGFDLAITNSDGTIDVLPGRGQGFFDDRTPQIISLGSSVTRGPVFADGLGVLPTQDGGLVAFNEATLTPIGLVFGSAGVNAVAALPDGRLVVAEAGGSVEVLQLDASGQFRVSESVTTGIPSEPDALAILESAAGIEGLVTQAGTDNILVFDFPSASISTPGANNPFPPLPQSTPPGPGAVPLSEAPLVVVVTLLSGGLPESSPASNTLPGNPEAGPAAFPPVSGDETQAAEQVVAVLAASEGPDPIEALRDRDERLYQPGEEDQAVTPPGPSAAAALAPANAPRALAAIDTVWEDLSWLQPQPLGRPDAALPDPAARTSLAGTVEPLPEAPAREDASPAETKVAQAEQVEIRQGTGTPGPERPAEAAARSDGSVRWSDLAWHAVVLLGALVLPWSGRPGKERSGSRSTGGTLDRRLKEDSRGC
jgi:hypothetical protein